MVKQPEESSLTLLSTKCLPERERWQLLALLSGSETPVLLCTVLGKLVEELAGLQCTRRGISSCSGTKHLLFLFVKALDLIPPYSPIN